MKILVIQNKMIGDVLISSMICNNLKIEYPDAQVDFLIYPFTKPVVEHNPYIDNIILYEEKFRKNYFSLFKFLLKIRRKKYDIVIDPYAKIESSLVTLFSGAKQRIGYKNKGLSIAYNSKKKHHNKPTSNFGLAIERRINLFEKLIVKTKLNPKPKLFLSDDEKIELLPEFEKYNLNPSAENVIMVSILGSESAKTYPEEFMAKLLDFIAENFNVKMLFNYIPKQHDEALSLYNQCNQKTKDKIVLDFIGSDLRSFIKIMYHCKLIIGNDGGAVNIAKALEKPSFTLFSPWIKKENWSIFEDGIINKAVHLNDFKPELFTTHKKKILKENHQQLYSEFTPDLIYDSLSTFLKNNL